MTPSPPRAPLPSTLVILLVVLLLAALEVVARYEPNTWINRDGRFYTNVNATLVESGSFEQPEFCASWYDGRQGWNRNLDASWSNLALGREGRRYPKHPVLLPVLSTPLFWAFGVFGNLLFNVAAFALAGLFAYELARRHAPPIPSALASMTFLLATGIRDYAYDYHVDILLLALFLGGLVALGRGRGALGGALLAACVTLKPTVLLWVPALALFVEPAPHEKTRWRALGRAIGGGAVVLALFALANTIFFGRPWWAGYNRVLVVVAGELQVADVSNTFDVPWDDGLAQLWNGPHGIRDRLTLALYALPGLALLWRRPRVVVAVVFALASGVVLFARYRWYADRFLWPAVALLVPALALLLAHVPRWFRLPARPPLGPSVGVGLAFLLVTMATLPGGGPLMERVPDSAWSLGAEALADGDLAVTPGPFTLARGDHHVARQSPVATIAAAPFARLGRFGLLGLHVLLAGLLGASLARLAREARVTGVSAALPAVIFLLFPGVTPRLLDGGPELLAAALGFGGLALVRSRPVLGGALAGVALLVASAPWPFAAAALALAKRRRWAALGVAVGVGVTLGANFAVLGAANAWLPGSARELTPTMFVLVGAALLGLLVAPTRFVPVALISLGALAPGAPLDLVLPAALCFAVGPLVEALARGLASTTKWGPRARGLAVASAVLALVVVGAVPRATAAGEPLRFASYRGLRAAKVKLGEAPCDFLNWQHMTWECATKDQGVLGMVGLPVTLPVRVGDRDRGLLRIPNQGPWARTVTWEALPATDELALRWAVPDDASGHAAALVVRVVEHGAASRQASRPEDSVLQDSAPQDSPTAIERRLELPAAGDGRVHVTRIDTSALAGRRVDVSLRLEGRGATVAVDGGF